MHDPYPAVLIFFLSTTLFYNNPSLVNLVVIQNLGQLAFDVHRIPIKTLHFLGNLQNYLYFHFRAIERILPQDLFHASG